MSQTVRYVGQLHRDIRADVSVARCPDPACRLLFGHSPWCSLDMSAAAMSLGDPDVAALVDRKVGL